MLLSDVEIGCQQGSHQCIEDETDDGCDHPLLPGFDNSEVRAGLRGEPLDLFAISIYHQHDVVDPVVLEPVHADPILHNLFEDGLVLGANQLDRNHPLQHFVEQPSNVFDLGETVIEAVKELLDLFWGLGFGLFDVLSELFEVGWEVAGGVEQPAEPGPLLGFALNDGLLDLGHLPHIVYVLRHENPEQLLLPLVHQFVDPEGVGKGSHQVIHLVL